jgi:YesN/AraC family two-component response regulator
MLGFIDIEKREVKTKFNMSDFQSHDFFELYFLLSGKREVFIENKLFNLSGGTMCVIAPYSVHKTEGDAYVRLNLYIAEQLLNKDEKNFLLELSHKSAFSLTDQQTEFISLLLQTASEAKIANASLRANYLSTFAKTAISYLSTQTLSPLTPSSIAASRSYTNTTILQIVSYINENYRENITLDSLSERFFLSKITLCKRFKQSMNCSVIQYVTYVRLNKAKQYLSSTKKDMETIAELCGFPSANYFSLIFKKHFGLSPLNFRKKQ